MTIRRLEIKDTDRVSEIENKSFLNPWSKEAIKESILRSVTESPSFVITACAFEDELCGYAFLYIAAGEGELVNIAVDEKMRGCGIGTRLIEFLVSEAEKNGTPLESICLEVRKSNDSAIRLYEKNGFENLGIRKNFYSNPKEDAIIMKMALGG